MIRDKLIQISGLILAMIALTGCGAKKENVNVADIYQDNPVLLYTDILEKDWKEPTELTEQLKGWEVVEYNDSLLTEYRDDSVIWQIYTASARGKIYSLTWWKKDGETPEYRAAIKQTDPFSMESITLELDFDQLKASSSIDTAVISEIGEKMRTGFATPQSIDINNDDIIIFFAITDVELGELSYKRVEINIEGELTGITDYPGLSEIYPLNADADGSYHLYDIHFFCGAGSDTYFFDEVEDKISFINDSGKISEIKIRESIKPGSIELVGKSINGVPILTALSEGNKRLYFSLKGKDCNVLLQGAIEGDRFFSDEYGNIIIFSVDKMIAWDTETGKEEMIYSFSGMSDYECKEIVRDSGGDFGLFCVDRTEYEEGFIYRISYAPDFEKKELVISEPFDQPYIINSVNDYNRTHPGVVVKVETIENRDGLEWNLLVENIKAGVGPDMILLNRRNLEIFKDADVLFPVDSLISEETKSGIFEGIFKFGELGSEHYALPFEGGLGISMIKRKYWDRDGWTLEEALDAYEAAKLSNDKLRRVECLSFSTSPEQLLYDFCLCSVENSEFLDLENGKCDFENESFYRLLEFCKENAEEDSGIYLSEEECSQQMINDEAFVFGADGGLINFSMRRGTLGDDYRCVGIPSENKIVSTAMCYWGVAVNGQSENIDLVGDVLEYLVSDHCQSRYTVSWIRKDVLLKHVKDSSDGYENPVFEIGTRAHVEMMGRKDGYSYLDEYIELMDKAVQDSAMYEVHDIILEETGAYFYGDKSPEEVAKIIQSRVMLLLNENR